MILVHLPDVGFDLTLMTSYGDGDGDGGAGLEDDLYRNHRWITIREGAGFVNLYTTSTCAEIRAAIEAAQGKT